MDSEHLMRLRSNDMSGAEHQNHLVVNALLFFSSYLLPPTLRAHHHLPNHVPTQKSATKAPCRCGSNVLGRPPRSPRCRCIWWRSAHSWGSPSQHLHLDLRRQSEKWGENEEPLITTKKTTMNHWIYRGPNSFSPCHF